MFHLLDRHFDLGAAAHQYGGLGRKLHQPLKRVGGSALGACLEHLTDGDERQDHRGGLEVEVHHIRHDRLVVLVDHRAGHGEQHVDAPHERHAAAHRNQRIHIRRAVQHAVEPADKKFLVDEHDDRREDHLYKPHRDVVPVEKRW